MRFLLYDHQGKGAPIGRALVSQGHAAMTLLAEADLLLIDHEHFDGGRLRLIRECHARGIPVVIYPHGAAPQVAYDGCQEVSPHVTALLVPAEGHRQVFERFDYPHPVHVIGWHFCPLGPLAAPKGKIEHVLYAPGHPWYDGRSHHSSERIANEAIFTAFCRLDVPRKTVRYFGEPYPNGIDDLGRKEIRFVESDLSIDWTEIDEADVVIATGTYAYLALARGKPVVWFGQNRVSSEDGQRLAEKWDCYADLMRYPLDAFDAPLAQQVARAANGASHREQIEQFRRTFIGRELDPVELARLLVTLVADHRHNHDPEVVATRKLAAALS
jgi:hypothetical protein